MATIKHGNLAIADVAVIIGYILDVIVVGMSSFIVIDFVYGWSCKSFLKIRNIHRKKPVLESLFNDAMGLGLQLYLRTLQHRCFPVNIT